MALDSNGAAATTLDVEALAVVAVAVAVRSAFLIIVMVCVWMLRCGIWNGVILDEIKTCLIRFPSLPSPCRRHFDSGQLSPSVVRACVCVSSHRRTFPRRSPPRPPTHSPRHQVEQRAQRYNLGRADTGTWQLGHVHRLSLLTGSLLLLSLITLTTGGEKDNIGIIKSSSLNIRSAP